VTRTIAVLVAVLAVCGCDRSIESPLAPAPRVVPPGHWVSEPDSYRFQMRLIVEPAGATWGDNAYCESGVIAAALDLDRDGRFAAQGDVRSWGTLQGAVRVEGKVDGDRMTLELDYSNGTRRSFALVLGREWVFPNFIC